MHRDSRLRAPVDGEAARRGRLRTSLAIATASAVVLALAAGPAVAARRGTAPATSRAAARAVVDLGTLPGGVMSGAAGLNSAGYVVGYTGVTDTTRAVLWRPNGSGSFAITDLGTLPGGDGSFAY